MKQLWKESRGNLIGGLAAAAVLAFLSWLGSLYIYVGLKPYVIGGLVLLWMGYLGYVVYWFSRRGKAESTVNNDKRSTSSIVRDNDRPVIAIDVRHGVRVDSMFTQQLEAHGFSTIELATPLTGDSLSKVRVLTLFASLPDHVKQPLKPEEIAAIHSFVVHGGGLFLIGLGWAWQDYGAKRGLTMDDYPLNRISHPQFGIHFRGEYLDNSISKHKIINGYRCTKFDSTNMAKHPVTKGLGTVFSFGMSSTLEVTPPAVPLIWDGENKDKCVLAAWDKPEQGRVICLQHEGYFKDQYIQKYDNLNLLTNIVQWLTPISASNTSEPELPSGISQTATGNHIAQASHGGTAIVETHIHQKDPLLEAINALSKQLVQVEKNFKELRELGPPHSLVQQEKEIVFETAKTSKTEFSDSFKANQYLLPEDLFNKLEDLINKLESILGDYLLVIRYGLEDNETVQRMNRGFNRIVNELPKDIKEIWQEFRRLSQESS